MGRIALLVMAGGGFLFWYGLKEFRVGQGATAEPERHELAELEAGADVTNNHLELGEHVCVYPELIYSYSSSSKKVTDETRINYAYYPVISDEHPFMQALAELAERHGGLENVPEDVAFPTIDRFAVLVKTERFETFGRVPDLLARAPAVRGLRINEIEGLESEEARLLKRSFPSVNLDEVLILHEGRTPSSPALSFAAMGGGAGLFLLPLGVLVFRRRGGDAAEGEQES